MCKCKTNTSNNCFQNEIIALHCHNTKNIIWKIFIKIINYEKKKIMKEKNTINVLISDQNDILLN